MLNASERLSSELWALVFVQLSPNQWRPGTWPNGLAKEDVEQYPHLHRLQLVCRKFAAVFRQHNHLFGSMYLRENLVDQALPGLLTWLQRHNSDISFLQSRCSRGPCTDVALTSLVGTQKLRAVDLTSPTNSAMQILSVCSSLVACTLRRPCPSLDLDSLERLQKLVYLDLQDGSISIPLTCQLSALALFNAVVNVTAVAQGGCGLQHLSMKTSFITGLENGICAFSGLKELVCVASPVQASTDACKLSTRVDSGQVVDLQGLSTLTQLESLTLHIVQGFSYPRLEPVYALASLSSLTLAGHGRIHVTTELSCLTNLTQLTVQGHHRVVGRRHEAKLAMQWSYLPALQALKIECLDFYTDDMTVLIQSKDLKAVKLSSTQPASMTSFMNVARLVHLLGSERPDVEFMC